MINTYYNAFPIENVETLPLHNNFNEEAMFLVNDFKNIINPDVLGSDSELDRDNLKKDIKKNRDFGKLLFHKLRQNNTFYTKTQKWLGHIIAFTENGFTAVLKDITNGGTEEFAEFSNDEITDDDLNLISVGATFYMSLGFISSNGSRKKESEIRFQRLADFDEDEINNRGLDLTSDFLKHFK